MGGGKKITTFLLIGYLAPLLCIKAEEILNI